MRRFSRISASIASAFSGSSVSGRKPARPRITARSVAWPLPVKASEPWRRHSSRATGPAPGILSSPAASFSRKRPAATIGPMVCELDGPTPILKISKMLRNMSATPGCLSRLHTGIGAGHID